MKKQCSFLKYLYQENGTVNYKSICVCKTVRVCAWLFELLFDPQWNWISSSSENSLVFSMLLHFVQGNFFQLPHQPLEQSTLNRHLIIPGIYWVAASKSVSTRINLFDFMSNAVLLHEGCFPHSLSYLEICLKIWHLKTDSVRSSVPGLTKDSAVVTF